MLFLRCVTCEVKTEAMLKQWETDIAELISECAQGWKLPLQVFLEP